MYHGHGQVSGANVEDGRVAERAGNIIGVALARVVKAPPVAKASRRLAYRR